MAKQPIGRPGLLLNLFRVTAQMSSGSPRWFREIKAAQNATPCRQRRGSALSTSPRYSQQLSTCTLDPIPWYRVYLLLSLKESSRMALTIGQVADAADVNIQTVRYYERRGLFPTPRRTPAGYRQYAEDAVARL